MVVLCRGDSGESFQLERDGSVSLNGRTLAKSNYPPCVQAALRTPRQLGTTRGVAVYRTPRGALAYLQLDGSFKRLTPTQKAMFTGVATPRAAKAPRLAAEAPPRAAKAVPKRFQDVRPVCAAETAAGRPRLFELKELQASAREWAAKHPNHPQAASIVASIEQLTCAPTGRADRAAVQAAIRSVVKSTAPSASLEPPGVPRKRQRTPAFLARNVRKVKGKKNKQPAPARPVPVPSSSSDGKPKRRATLQTVSRESVGNNMAFSLTDSRKTNRAGNDLMAVPPGFADEGEWLRHLEAYDNDKSSKVGKWGFDKDTLVNHPQDKKKKKKKQ